MNFCLRNHTYSCRKKTVVQTTEKSSSLHGKPEDYGHKNAGQDNRREWSPIIQTFPTPSCHTTFSSTFTFNFFASKISFQQS